MPEFSIKNYHTHQEDVKRVCLKYYQWALDRHLHSLRIVIADQYYYDKTLEQRQAILGTLSPHYLCKTIVFENTAYNPKFASEFYPKYLAVMVQYVAKINTEKLNKEVKLYQNHHAHEKASKQHFHFRLVEDSHDLTGYEHNGVVPVLLKTNMPIIFSHHIPALTPQFFWMGAGHPWIKMRMSYLEFQTSYPDKVLVFDITY